MAEVWKPYLMRRLVIFGLVSHALLLWKLTWVMADQPVRGEPVREISLSGISLTSGNPSVEVSGDKWLELPCNESLGDKSVGDESVGDATDFSPDPFSLSSIDFPTVPPAEIEEFFTSEAKRTLQEFRLSSGPYTISPIDGSAHGLGAYETQWSGQDDLMEGGCQWEILPPGLMYRSYLAGEKEPRMAWSALYDFKRERTVWETALGGRAGLLRYGTDDILNPQGFQLDAEGAVFTRLLPGEPSTMMEAADFRFGFLATYRKERTAYKVGYYHISSHLGDEFLIANPTFPRINYVRDAAIVGVMRDLTPSIQAYGEVANALGREGGAEPWEFQWGCQYCPAPIMGNRGAPYAGVNFYSRQDFNFEPSLNVIVGWNWVGSRTGERFRVGMQYYNGPALQYSFFDRRERLLGGGLWFDY
jgi:hypothetical protein